MISVVPEQARAFRAWIIASLNTNDDGATENPPPFGESNVRWAPTDYPRAGNLYAMLREVSLDALGAPMMVREPIDTGLPTEDLIVRTWVVASWTVSVQVVAKLSDSSPSLSQSAARYLRRVSMRVLDERSDTMRAVGCAWQRSGQILPLDRLSREGQWETRAALDLTFAVGEVIVDRPGWIESVAGTADLAPLPSSDFTASQDDVLP